MTKVALSYLFEEEEKHVSFWFGKGVFYLVDEKGVSYSLQI